MSARTPGGATPAPRSAQGCPADKSGNNVRGLRCQACPRSEPFSESAIQSGLRTPDTARSNLAAVRFHSPRTQIPAPWSCPAARISRRRELVSPATLLLARCAANAFSPRCLAPAEPLRQHPLSAATFPPDRPDKNETFRRRARGASRKRYPVSANKKSPWKSRDPRDSSAASFAARRACRDTSPQNIRLRSDEAASATILESVPPSAFLVFLRLHWQLR